MTNVQTCEGWISDADGKKSSRKIQSEETVKMRGQKKSNFTPENEGLWFIQHIYVSVYICKMITMHEDAFY